MSSLMQFSWLAQHVPAFGINGSKVRVIQKPQEFYQTIKSEASKAKKRIVLSSLYLGTGVLEQEFVDTLYAAQKANPDLTLRILLDFTRGSRGEHNSRTMLLPLLRDFGDRTEVALYHTPNLRGIWKRVTPDRYNETIGVQHMKVYLFDDNLIMSGANLSQSYFTNRQDRHMMFIGCTAVANFFASLVDSVASTSFKLKANNEVYLPEDLGVHPYIGSEDGKSYREEVSRRVKAIIEPSQYKDSKCNMFKVDENVDTWVFPVIQMGPFNITVDGTVTTNLLTSMPEGSTVKLASGYFNLTDHYKDTIVNKAKAKFDILAAGPEANGFYGGQGISGYVPAVYTYIAHQFYNQYIQANQQHRITLYEYHKPSWTFHGKGLWGYLPGQALPQVTLMGSPNFGHRSVYRDLEAQVVVLTENKSLQKQLHEEQEILYSTSTKVTSKTYEEPKRHVPLWTVILTQFIRSFF